jgi:cellulose synthase/poly-beta-1,6-N-acetylglucosamine synthase-like glycosyltransferase
MCWIILLYTWVGYPQLLVFLTKTKLFSKFFLSKKRWLAGGLNKCEDKELAKKALCSRKQTVDLKSNCFASFSVIVSAYNEEKHIAARIRDLLEADCAKENLNIRIGVDGSKDRTAEIAKQQAVKYPNIKVYTFSERRGKVAVLKDLVSDSHEEILIFTDANTIFKSDAVNRLLRHFSDPLIGGVCGRLSFRGEEKEGIYWRWETKLKLMESNLDSCLGANGGIYAIRRSLFWKEIPSNTIVDDFVIGMKVREQGFRMIYEPLASAEEDYPTEIQEWGRRVRIGTGDYQAFWLCRKCLLPKYGKFAWMFCSHKVLRWFTPHLLIGLLLIAFLPYIIGSTSHEQFGILFLITRIFFLLIFVSLIVSCISKKVLREDRKRIWLKFAELPHYFITMQIALFFGFLRFCRGNLQGHWQRTSRD